MTKIDALRIALKELRLSVSDRLSLRAAIKACEEALAENSEHADTCMCNDCLPVLLNFEDEKRNEM